MKNVHKRLKLSALAIVCLGAPALSSAQSFDPTLPVTLTYAERFEPKPMAAMPYAVQSRSNTWNTVMIVSGIVLVVGLITDESTLVILGGVGVIVSLVQMERRFQLQYSPRGIDLFQKGPITFGLNPFSQPGLVDRPGPPRTGLYLAASFKF